MTFQDPKFYNKNMQLKIFLSKPTFYEKKIIRVKISNSYEIN